MKKVSRPGGGLLATLLVLLFTSLLCFVSCNVTRVITTTQTHMKNGDTIAVMSTRTAETYSAKKDL